MIVDQAVIARCQLKLIDHVRPRSAAVNATLNALSGILLLVGYVLIRARRIEQHRTVHDRGVRHLVAVPGLLLIYHAQVGSVPFTRQGFVRPLYFTILITHVTLAAAVLPLAIVTLSRGLKARYPQHRAHRALDVSDLDVRVGDRRARLRAAVSADLAALNR